MRNAMSARAPSRVTEVAAVPNPVPAWRTKLFYALGAIAFGVKDNGFGVFLLLYYNQVLGLSAGLAGTALLIALFIDAFIDPLVGHLSDNLHSRWGRRHPFMYAAAVPVAVAYAMLWNPPPLHQEALFFYLLFGTILVRTLITCYEIPSAALAAELTDDYDERTSYVSLRWFCGYSGGLFVGLIALRFLMHPSAQQPVATLNPEGYRLYGMMAGAIMLTAILVSSIGTHHTIPHLRKPPPKSRLGVLENARVMIQTLSNRSALVLVGCGFIWAIATGMLGTLGLYLQTYFWELSAKQISIVGLGTFAAYVLALLATQWFARRWGKKVAAIIGGVGWIVLGPLPIWLRLWGLFPSNDSPWLLPTYMAFSIAHTAIGVVSAMVIGSMMADVAEDVELKTGRRSEGLLFSANAFIAKATSGVGLFVSGALLVFVNFPAHARPHHVAQAVLNRLALTYSVGLLALYSIAMLLLASYSITRASHATALETLAQRRQPAR
jgi:GPH family glycoside/pentoside/hexuronide:cation symporter